MKWNHLPVAGGLYNQHPSLLARWEYIFAKRAEQQEKERKAEERKNKPAGRARTAGRRR